MLLDRFYAAREKSWLVRFFRYCVATARFNNRTSEEVCYE
jgi:hypothetical protein